MVSSHKNILSPTAGAISTTSMPKKQTMHKKLSSHRASHSAIEISKPKDPIEVAREMSEIQKSIDDMNIKMYKMQQKAEEEQLKFMAKNLENEQKSSFHDGLRKKLLSIKQGQLMINTSSGEQLY